MSDKPDGRLEAMVAAVLRGEPGAADDLYEAMAADRLDSRPLARRALAGLDATQAELADLHRQVAEGGGDHLAAQADAVLDQRQGLWWLLAVWARLRCST